MPQTIQNTILIVDDEENILIAFRKILTEAGYTVETASSGVEALKRMNAFHPSLVLCDIVLPDINGMDLLRMIKQDPNTLDCFFVLMSSKMTSSANQTEGLEAGADGYFLKPVQKNELIARTEAYMRHRQTIDRLRSSEERFREIVEQNADGIIIVDKAGLIRFANPQASVMFGLPPDQIHNAIFGYPVIQGDNTEVQIIRDRKKSSIAEMRAVEMIYEGEPMNLVSLRDLTVRINTEHELMDLKKSLENQVEKRTGELNEQIEKLNKSQKAMLYMVEDLNEMTHKLRQEQINLQEANRELESFSYSVSHDLRAPLRAIDGFLRILLEDHLQNLDQEEQRLFNVVLENTKKMGHLIDDLLAFSRLSRAPLNTRMVDMHRLAQDVFLELTTPEMRSNIDFKLEEICAVHADASMIKQVWINLISNALKFSAPNRSPSIHIACTMHPDADGFCEYSVTDNGVGFDMQYANKLFGVFQRLHSARDFEGTGVGLAIVQRVIHRHGGRVKAMGEPNKGAGFFFSLPLSHETVTHPKPNIP